ncbi:hypothetical protein Gpo141_00005892 [Globisporangium polare]
MSTLVIRPSSPHRQGEAAASSTPPSPLHDKPTSPSHSRPSSPSHPFGKNATASVPPTVKKGNRLAHFFILSALSCVLYQFVTNGGGQLTMKTDTSHQTSTSSSSAIQFSSSEYTCILACMGLFGLMRHKTKEVAKQGAEEEEDDDEQEDEIARELLLTEKRVRTLKRKQDASTKKSVNTLALSQFSRYQGACGMFNQLPPEVLHELLLFLGPQELSQLPILNKHWNATTGDDADELWQFVYQRDFKESGERFHVVFPFDSWRQFYFQHHLSRAVELARLLGVQEDKKLCVAIENQVYDVTSFIHSHPGGYHVIGDVVGTDATEIWDQFQHSQEAKESMKEFMVHDHILSQSTSGGRDNLRLQGNLAVVVTRWERISWCLANAHNFGPMASAFTDVMFKFHSRAIKKSRVSARLGLAR